MSNLKHWQNKIKETRKNTDFRDFLMEIGSWTSVVFNKYDWLISRYPKTDRVKLCSISEFESNRDDYVKNWLEYDFSKNFFENFEELFKNTPLPNLFHVWENENCDYVDTAVHIKNSYLSSLITLGSENVFYSFMIRENSINVFNSFYVITNNENIYFSSYILYSFNVFYSKYIKNSSNIWFSTNLTGCNECIFCDDLQNCSYYIKNEKYEKEEYFLKKEEILKDKAKFLDWYKSLNKIWNNYNSTNVSWNFVLDSNNVENGYWIFNMTNGRNLMFSWSDVSAENCYDLIFWWKGTVDCYWTSNFGWNPENVYMSYNVWYWSNIFYSYWVVWCSYCIWCVWIQNKQYCILNKQYTKQEWEELSDKIFSQMEDDNILWKYFPWSLNPLHFNDSFAWLVWNFTRDEVEKKWFMWKEDEIKVDIPEWADVIHIKDLYDYEWYDSNQKWKINPEILKKVIVDEKGNYYKIVQMEYDFLVKYSLPLPKIHWLDRMKLNFGV